MNIHEYQAKDILRSYKVNVPKGEIASSSEEIIRKLRFIESDIVAIKAQIHAGGRGKAGGVKIATSMSEAIEAANEMLNKKLITKQTSPEGQLVRTIYMEEGCSIKNELYLSLLIDRETSSVIIIASTEGGMDIEEVSEDNPNSIIKLPIDAYLGIQPFQIKYLSNKLSIPKEIQNDFSALLSNLYKCFIEKDLSMLEINPLVITTDNTLTALDVKMAFDDNALKFRHQDIQALRDIYEENPIDYEAKKHDLSYVSLDGNIACLVNGAGLAMATMDSIYSAGGSPANFLDVGGSATKEMISKSIEIILSDKNVRGIFINIFGGIMKCDTIAQGIIEAMLSNGVDIPLVVRLEGNNVEIGNKLLENSKLNIITADSMDEGSKKIVDILKKGAD